MLAEAADGSVGLLEVEEEVDGSGCSCRTDAGFCAVDFCSVASAASFSFCEESDGWRRPNELVRAFVVC